MGLVVVLAGTVVGVAYANNLVHNCYGISNLDAECDGAEGTGDGNTTDCGLDYKSDSGSRITSNPIPNFNVVNYGSAGRQGTNSAVFSYWTDFMSSVSSLPAENGWSKFWTLDTANGIIKMGNNVIYQAS